MQANDLRARLRSFSLRSAAKPALYLLSFTIAGASCAAELEDPDRYEVAKGVSPGTGGSVPAATGGTPGSGGTIGATGGTAPVTGGTTATGGTGDPTGGAASNVTTVDACVKTAFMTNICTSCHYTAGKATAGDLDLTGDDAAIIASLKDVIAGNKMATNAAACGTLLINSANPAESVLLKRIRGSGDCGPGMPFNGHNWSANDRKCIEDWVMKF